ncbi:MAG: polyprenyl synthetase family protein [Arenicellales bacterium]|nr:polyprenyl synthetase family protein [Arenicellales bacterium]
MTHSDHLEACWQRWRERLEAYLDRLLPAAKAPPEKLHAAMRYAAVGAGKRYRAALVYATGTSLGASEESLDAAAGAIELIHAFSLVHDDLPAMDDDDLRRGKPTCHKAFDEATAILAGDALQTLAFEAMAAEPVPQIAPARRLQMLEVLARTVGSQGLAGGQAIDLDLVSKTATCETLATMHNMKTGALILAAVQLGALTATDDPESLQHLVRYAQPLGLAFQVVDDILDGTSDTATLGKTAGADRALDKPTFFSVLGEDAARQYAEEQGRQAIAALETVTFDTSLLEALARFTLQRSH